MKNRTWRLIIVGLVLMTLVSCVSISDRTIPRSEMGTVEVIGKVQTTFTSWQFFHITPKKTIIKKAYNQLLEQALQKYQEYQGEIDISNINIKGTFSFLNLLSGGAALLGGAVLGNGLYMMANPQTRDPVTNEWLPPPNEHLRFPYIITTGLAMGTGTFLFGNLQEITATGDVVLLEQPTNSRSRSRVNRANATGIEKAIYTVSDDLINDLPANSKIAVINISSNNRDTSALVVDELEYHLVSAKKFTIVDRRTLDTIRAEQNFQMSGDVSDASAVSIGQMLGANIVITGSITGTGTNQRLSIKALDVKTAQIVTMVRETF